MNNTQIKLLEQIVSGLLDVGNKLKKVSLELKKAKKSM
jgi:hypothetical protein